MNEYKSSMLRCDVGEDNCPVCRFVSGSRDTITMLEVIWRMDKALSKSESDFRALSRGVASHMKDTHE